MKIKKYFAVLFILTITLNLFSQTPEEKLNYLNTSWSSVISGEVIAEPAITSYGFAVATDGKMISAFSNEGTLLWEKPTRSSKNVSITALPDDFILLWDNRHKEMKLLNPSGGEIWTKKLKYTLNNKPVSGRDGRIFVTGDGIIECYGINGIRKWSLKTGEQRNIPVQEAPDGSIILFLAEQGSQTTGIRISPFGQILEEITFTGTVKDAFTTKDGVFLIFTDGSSGMFTITDNLAKNKWVVEKKAPNSTLVVSPDDYLYLELNGNKVVVNNINNKDGTITSSFIIDNINGLDLKITKLTSGGLFISDSTRSYLYSSSGIKKWSALLPENSGSGKWNYVIYTNDNHLIFCLENWSVNAYLTVQGLGRNNKYKRQSYNSYYKIDTLPYDYLYTETLSRKMFGDERLNKIAKGDYGIDEVQYTSELFSMCSAYLNKAGQKLGVGRKVPSVFDKDGFGVESAFSQLGYLGTADAANYLAKLVNQTSDPIYLQVLFNTIGKCGYDPQGKILKELGNLIPKINHKETNLLHSACDAVYNICLFMGRPAFNRMGKDILMELMYPKYDNVTREYVRDTLKKIMDIDL